MAIRYFAIAAGLVYVLVGLMGFVPGINVPGPADAPDIAVDSFYGYLPIQFSPDGSRLYVFGDDILIYETERFTLVDRWDLSRPAGDGMGRIPIFFGYGQSPFEDFGSFTNIFTVTEPIRAVAGFVAHHDFTVTKQ